MSAAFYKIKFNTQWFEYPLDTATARGFRGHGLIVKSSETYESGSG